MNIRMVVVLQLGLVAAAHWVHAADPEAARLDPAAVDFFEKKIRPVLVNQCYECHSVQAKVDGKLKGGLLLDSRQASQTGGDSGPSVVPRKLDESLIIEAIRYGEDSYQMPPAGKLPDLVIADFEKWIAMGAPDPRDAPTAVTARTEINWDVARQHWSFQEPENSPTPEVKETEWVQKPIDAFILAKLEEAGLKHSERAQRQTLLRRASFDLTGLPPTVEQLDEFLNDTSPDAFAKLVDRLLDSPSYGERWARHWLDVARYSEDNTNMGPHNGPYPHAWRYRDWVVQALNDDVPYDEFIVRQLATDFLPETGPEDHAALGFQGLAPSYHKEVALAKLVLENRYADEWEDRVDAIGRGLLGLTLACARCHNHKYDPVTVEDYYSLASIFASCRQTTRPVITDEEIAKTQPVRDKVTKLEEQLAAWDKQIKELPKEIAELEKKLKEHSATTAAGASTASASPDEPAVEKKTDDKKADDKTTDASAEGATPDVFDPDKAQQRIVEAKELIEKAKAGTTETKAEVAELKKTPGFEVPVADALTEEQVRVEEISKERMKIVYYPNKPRDLNVFIRGDAGRLGAPVQRRFLQLLSPEKNEPYTNGSGRLELARAITSRDNPLTARVFVNRVWMHHFGMGLVDSPSNFGVTGSRPSHPKLLDDLAVRFMDNGWSLKWLHREIMLSSTYQQSSLPVDAVPLKEVDPDNRLLAHFNRRRLNAEAFRDSVLAVSGQLDPTVGGPSGDADKADFKRRTLYSAVSRHKLSDTLQTFDFPDPAIHCARRADSTTPLQQMFILNSPFMREQAAALANRVGTSGSTTNEQKVKLVHRLLFARDASAVELAIAREFLPEDLSASASSARLSDAEAVAPTFSGKRVRADIAQLGDNYSVEMWIRNTLPVSSRPVTGYIFSRGAEQPATDHGDHFGISGTSGGQPGRLLFYNGATHKQSVRGAEILKVNQWYHVALVRSGKTVSLYLNGDILKGATVTANPGYKSGVGLVFVGGRRDNFANFQGQIQEAALFNRSLTSEEVAQHYSASSIVEAENEIGRLASHADYATAILKSEPIAYWPLRTDPLTAAQASDRSENSNHGVYEGRAGGVTVQTRWSRYAHALLSSNEFLFID
ncbi:MAG: DUF1553 domain-containing protein [Rhodopirellula sp.]|nr:DUF1553 domain-containing protein [Rhodopirellula sp.]